MKSIILLLLFIACCNAGSFKDKVNKVMSMINVINKMETTWKAGKNFDDEDYVVKLLATSKPRPKITLPERDSLGPIFVPAKFDARQKWPDCPTIGTIEDQGACGACWAVAGAATFSDRVCIASGGQFKMPLSAHHVLSCCGFTCGSTQCDGGDDYRAWNYFKKHGLVTGGRFNSSIGCKPYPVEPCEHNTNGDRPNCYTLAEPHIPECSDTCTNQQYDKTIEQDIHKAKSSYKVMSDPAEIKKEIMTNGPVQAGFTVYEDFQFYKEGIYKYVTGKKIGEHSMRIIGWGNEKGINYWIVANTWNTNWGENGFVRVLMGKNVCGIESAIHAGVPA